MEFRIHPLSLVIVLFSTINIEQISGLQNEHNLTNWQSLRRQKRTLVYQTAGTAKIVCGFLMPVQLAQKYRQLNFALNFQAQYALPQVPIYWWDKWNRRSLERVKEEYETKGTIGNDESRKLVYTAIEAYMNRIGKNGRKCLQRAICENAEIDEVEGIYSELLHAVLTPGENYDDEDYKDAHRAGKSGAVCTSLYPECPIGEGILDSISVIKTRGFFNNI